MSPVYYMNIDKFEQCFYAEGTYLNSTNLIQSNNGKIIELSKQISVDSSNDYEKALLIHDWIAGNIYYDFDALNGDEGYGDTSAMGVFESKKSVCAGYANFTAALLRAEGIPCKVVSGRTTYSAWIKDVIFSEDISHAWNEAYIDGRWMIIDSTWDSNNRYENGQFLYKKISDSRFFDPSIEWFSLDHKIVN